MTEPAMPNQPPPDTDIWLLAGQSNMAGSGMREPYEEPSPDVWLFDLTDRWRMAEEPFTIDRLDAVDDALAFMRSEMSNAGDEFRAVNRDTFRRSLLENRWGAGLGLTFGKQRHAHTGRPVGLLFCAKGDTRMEEWDPDYDGPPAMALYEATMRRVRQVGRPLAGVLWYQGESDTFDGKAQLYRERMGRLVGALRRDTGQPDLPFFYVQIGNCFLQPEDELPDWNLVQELQRQLETELAPAAMTTAVDLPLGDGIHIATRGQRRLGLRLATLVRATCDGNASLRRGPRPTNVTRENGDACVLRVHFESVNECLLPADRVAGFSIHAPGEQRNLVNAARVMPGDPSVVELVAMLPPPADSRLWYGKGMTTFCNLVDAQDMGAPAFGPWPVPE